MDLQNLKEHHEETMVIPVLTYAGSGRRSTVYWLKQTATTGSPIGMFTLIT